MTSKKRIITRWNKRLRTGAIIVMLLAILMSSCSHITLSGTNTTTESNGINLPNSGGSDTYLISQPNLAEKPDTVAHNWAFNLLISRDDAYIHMLDLYAKPMQEYIQPEFSGIVRSKINEQIGKVLSCSVESIETIEEYNQILIRVAGEDGAISMSVSIDADNKILGFDFFPRINLTELEKGVPLIIGEKDPLPGVLLTPEGECSSLAIILPGSGPQNLNGTYWLTHPYKDIAEGLCEFGIATYRFEKRSYYYQDKIDLNNDYTPKEEIINDALEIIKYFTTNHSDYKHLFLIGHSLSGYLLPMVYNNATEQGYQIDGLIYLGANASPIEDLMLDQSIRYAQEHDDNDLYSDQIKIVKEQVEIIRNLKPQDSDNKSILLGAPVSYWLFLKYYDPLIIASSTNVKMFFGFGEEDNNVPISEMSLWENAGIKNAVFYKYADLNHLFVSGSSWLNDSRLKEVHVSKRLIDDIANWIKSDM